MAKKFYTGIDGQGQVASNFADPSNPTDLGTKQYIDNRVNGLSWKDEVRVATTANGTLATAFANGQSVDGVTLATGDRILLKNQTNQPDNGIYIVAASGAPTRATDADSTAELNNATVFVTDGTAGTGLTYTQTTKNPTVGSSNLVWAQYAAGQAYTASLGVALSGTDFRLAAGASGAGLTLTSGVLDVVAGDTSITVSADSLAVNPAASGGLTVSSGLKVDSTVARIFRQATNANSTSIAVTHNLGTAAVIARVFITSTGEEIECGVTATSTTVTTFTFGTAPALNTLTFVIVG